MGPAEAVELAHVDELAHGAVGLGGVELDCALEADRLDHKLAELAYGQFLARAHINVAVAYLAERRDGAAAARAVVAIHNAVGSHAVMYRRVFLNAYDVAEVDIQQHVNASVGHILAPEELAQRLACAPQPYEVVLDAVECQHLLDEGLIAGAVDDVARSLAVLLDIGADGTYAHVPAYHVPVAVVQEFG